MTLMGFRGWVLGAKLDCQKQNQRVKEVTIRMFVKMEIDGSMINWMINSKSKALHLFQTLAVQTQKNIPKVDLIVTENQLEHHLENAFPKFDRTFLSGCP